MGWLPEEVNPPNQNGYLFFFFLEYSFTEENYVLIHLWKKFRRPAGHSWQEMPPKCSQAFNFYSMSGPIQEKTLTSWKRFYNQLAIFFFVCFPLIIRLSVAEVFIRVSVHLWTGQSHPHFFQLQKGYVCIIYDLHNGTACRKDRS